MTIDRESTTRALLDQALAERRELERQLRSARTAAAIERRLGGLVGSRGGVQALVAAAAELTNKVVVLYGPGGRVVCFAGAARSVRGSLPVISDLLAAAPAGAVWPDGPFEVPARPLAGVPRRHLGVAVLDGSEQLGWLVVLEHPSRLQPIDTLVAGCTATNLARELGIQRRIADVAWNARSSLARQLIRGSSDVDDLRAGADYLGVDIEARRVLVHAVGSLVESTSGEQQLAGALQRRLDVEVLTTRGSEGVLLLVQAPDDVSSAEFVARVKAALHEGAVALEGDLTAGVSGVCDPPSLARAYREAREVAHCIGRFAPRTATRVLAVDDLGPARLFLANSAVSAVRAYVEDVLGALLTGDPAAGDLITTLGSYFDHGRSVRIASNELGVHENTVRLRLARIHAATGLDVATDANDQLSAQTALLVLRLQGHVALPTFDPAAAQAGEQSA